MPRLATTTNTDYAVALDRLLTEMRNTTIQWRALSASDTVWRTSWDSEWTPIWGRSVEPGVAPVQVPSRDPEPQGVDDPEVTPDEWTQEMWSVAIDQEGWDITEEYGDDGRLVSLAVAPCESEAGVLLSEAQARRLVYTGTGEHHRLARRLLMAYDMDEYERCRKAAEEGDDV